MADGQLASATDALITRRRGDILWAILWTVPLRSSIVRGMIQQGAEKAVAVGAKANIAVQTLAVDYAAIKSTVITVGEARNGTCAAAFPVF